MRRRSVLALAGLCALAQQVAGDGGNTHALLVQRGASTLAGACFTGRTLAFSGLRLRPRELARIGRLLLDGGQWQGWPVVQAG